MMSTTAQVSLYPLRQESLSSVIDEAYRIFQDHDLVVEPGVMSTLITGDDTVIFDALQRAFRVTARQGEVVMVVTCSNACPLPGR